MYTIVSQKVKRNSFELKAVQAAKSLLGCESLTTLKDNWEQEVKLYKRQSIATIDTVYKMVLSEDYKTLELWHTDCRGTKDRMVLSISKK